MKRTVSWRSWDCFDVGYAYKIGFFSVIINKIIASVFLFKKKTMNEIVELGTSSVSKSQMIAKAFCYFYLLKIRMY